MLIFEWDYSGVARNQGEEGLSKFIKNLMDGLLYHLLIKQPPLKWVLFRLGDGRVGISDHQMSVLSC